MDENIGRSFSPLNVYDCYSTTKAAIDKWIAHVDSAHQRGLESAFLEVLTVVQSSGGGVDKNARNLRNSAPSSLIAQPEEIWTNGDDKRIQRIKRSRNTHLQSSDCR